MLSASNVARWAGLGTVKLLSGSDRYRLIRRAIKSNTPDDIGPFERFYDVISMARVPGFHHYLEFGGLY